MFLMPLAGCLWPAADDGISDDPSVVESDVPIDAAGEGDPIDSAEQGGGEAPDENESIFDRRPERLIVELEVHRIEAPAGVFGEDSPLWKIASSPIASAAADLRLRSNGFLAAVGRDSDRDDLVTFMKGLPKPAIATDRVQPDSSKLVDIEIGKQDGTVTLFHFDESGSVRGMEVEEPRMRFRLRCEFRSLNLRDVWLEVMPEIEEPPGPAKWVIGPDERARQVPQERRHTFKSVAFGVEIPQGGFLLLGATGSVYERPLLAKPFFLAPAGETKDGRERYRESVYVIRPIIRAVNLQKSHEEAAAPDGKADGE
ncbi:MAG: hypothetical protein H6819_05350 [Phycisphaerales bacterium]|nr:hypothetical protein [Phycisphaerales bacterium]MCB9854795.1 hypothetical protein [Phycisphaerales bacterium]MCB9863733.1 hypothetical protein [Phycisphaerales bacterium]